MQSNALLLAYFSIWMSQRSQSEVREVTFWFERWYKLPRRDACMDKTISRFLFANNFRHLGHQLHVRHCTACVCQGNSGKMTTGVTSWVQSVAYSGFHKEGKFLLATSAHTIFKRGQTKFTNFFPMLKFFGGTKGGHGPLPPLNTPLSSASVMALVTWGSEIGQSAWSIMSKYSTASKFGFAGTLNLCTCLLRSVTLAFIVWRNPSSHMCGRWSVITNHGQEQILWVSEVLVSLNGGINYLLVLGALASWLD